MNQDEYNKELNKRIEAIREVNSPAKDIQIEYTSEKIKELVASGKVPQELGEWFFKDMEEKSDRTKRWKKFIADTPELTQEERAVRFFGAKKALSYEDSLKHYDTFLKELQLFNLLVENLDEVQEENKQLRETINAINNEPHQLYKDVDLKKNFGVAGKMAMAVYQLAKLLRKNLAPTNKGGSKWEIKSSIKDSYGNEISLIHEFTAKTVSEAKEYSERYKKTMKTLGIRVFLAFWMEGNRHKNVQFTCLFKSVLSWLSKSERATRYTQKELTRYWDITQLLKKTTIETKQKKKRRAAKSAIKPQRDADNSLISEQPLITILGREQSDSKKYPHALEVRLLEKHTKKEFAPFFYKNATLGLNDSAVFLAFLVQTRGQRLEEINFDLDSVIEHSNLEGTAKVNKAEAKSKTRRNFESFKDEKIIDGYTIHENEVTIKTTPSRKKLDKTNIPSGKM
jgi:hypothetical protein